MGYPGGKGRLWQQIVSLMPAHGVYIETHLGSGAILRHKRCAHRSIGIDIDIAVISTAASWNVPGLTLHHGDAVAFLRAYQFQADELVYADPPYVASTKYHRRYYKHEYSDQDHVQLLETLCNLNCSVMISGYSCSIYESALRRWRRKELINTTRGGRRAEFLWTNFDHPLQLHDYGALGDSFRDRERIKRKVRRWVRKFKSMPALERNAVMTALLESLEVESRLPDSAVLTRIEPSE